MEKQRFYRAVSKPIPYGDNRGKIVVFTFRDDSIELARDHAEHCFRADESLGRLELARVNFIGTSEPFEMGKFHLAERDSW